MLHTITYLEDQEDVTWLEVLTLTLFVSAGYGLGVETSLHSVSPPVGATAQLSPHVRVYSRSSERACTLSSS